MSFGPDAVQRGDEDEDLFAAWLMQRGWSATLFGQRLWNPASHVLGRAQVINGVRRTERWPLRHAPDLLVAKEGMGYPRLVEVIRDGYDNGRRAVELAKLVSLDAWSLIAPVYVMDMAHRRAWRHEPGWCDQAVSDVTKRGRGSGDPYLLLAHQGEELPWDQVFP